MRTIYKNGRYYMLKNIMLVIGIISFLASCEKDMEGGTYQVYDDIMIDELMEKRSELSSFLKIVDIGGMRGTVHVHGTYTLFAPTNTAVEKYLTETGRSSVDELTQEEALNIVRYHMVPDTLATVDFIDGRLVADNFLNKPLTTNLVPTATSVSILVNRQGYIIEQDVRGANGYLHVIDNVLTPPSQSITDAINALPPDYRLIKEFFTRSKFSETLEKEADKYKWYTFFVQDNEAFESIDVNSYEDLIERLKEKTPEVTDEDSLLYNYIAYHCVPELSYVSNLFASSFLTTINDENIVLKRVGENVLLNEFNIGGQLEPGIPIDRSSDYTDLSCSNGVIHKINGNIEIVRRSAYRIYWDIGEQPEIMALRSFRKPGTTTFEIGDLSELTWASRYTGSVSYHGGNAQPPTVDRDAQYIYNDYLTFRLSTHVVSWIEFDTPLIPEGRYKVWICYRMTGNEATLRSIFKQEGEDDQINNFLFRRYAPSDTDYGIPVTEEAYHIRAEQDGWKRYNALTHSPVMNSVLIAIIDVTKTGRHKLRFEALGQTDTTTNWDMIQFIPIDEDQRWPRLDVLGNWIYQHTPECEIWPNVCTDPEPGEETEPGE